MITCRSAGQTWKLAECKISSAISIVVDRSLINAAEGPIGFDVATNQEVVASVSNHHINVVKACDAVGGTGLAIDRDVASVVRIIQCVGATRPIDGSGHAGSRMEHKQIALITTR
ncbi:hypothetical protein Pla52n_68710 [Stieleria varia]|uniref:Uncharacterized protein n=1 Tax=Stieleria varia TaxID=2528005 RepID=A0A5C5ZQQ0_9BACT|nr:hypothetical protein Pla52n_68710 [Stieleria varia]